MSAAMVMVLKVSGCRCFFFFMCCFGGDGGGGRGFCFGKIFVSCKKVLFKFEGFLKSEARVNESVECR